MAAKRRPGRPEIPPEQRRAHRIVAWVTRAEYAALGRLARAEGLTRSTLAADLLARALRRKGVK